MDENNSNFSTSNQWRRTRDIGRAIAQPNFWGGGGQLGGCK